MEIFLRKVKIGGPFLLILSRAHPGPNLSLCTIPTHFVPRTASGPPRTGVQFVRFFGNQTPPVPFCKPPSCGWPPAREAVQTTLTCSLYESTGVSQTKGRTGRNRARPAHRRSAGRHHPGYFQGHLRLRPAHLQRHVSAAPQHGARARIHGRGGRSRQGRYQTQERRPRGGAVPDCLRRLLLLHARHGDALRKLERGALRPEGAMLSGKGAALFGYTDLYGGYDGGRAEYACPTPTSVPGWCPTTSPTNRCCS